MADQQNVLIIGSVWPEPKSSAAGIRMMGLINLFVSIGWRVSFASPAADGDYVADLEVLNVARLKIDINSSEFDVMIKEINPSIVIFDRFMIEEQFGWRVAEHCPAALRVLNTEDLHCLRRERENALRAFKVFQLNDLLNSEVAKREIASILRCDMSLIISLYELNLLKSQFKIPDTLLHYHPFMTEIIRKGEVNSWPSFTDRANFVTIGNFLHAPNHDSVLFLKHEIWPLVRKQLPKAEMHIYGAYPTPKINNLNKAKEGFFVFGRAANAGEVMKKARVCLAPLRFGAGLKGKLFEAMRCGTPSVTTSIGSEAMHKELPWNGFIEDDPGEIAKQAVGLYLDETVWHTAQKNGIKIINQCFNRERYSADLINKIFKIQAVLQEHRLENFTGSMLMHHTMASTKYMSRWIESKNGK